MNAQPGRIVIRRYKRRDGGLRPLGRALRGPDGLQSALRATAIHRLRVFTQPGPEAEVVSWDDLMPRRKDRERWSIA